MSTNSILATTPLVTTNYLLRATGTTIGNSLIWDNGTNVGIGNTNTTYKLDVSGTGNFTGALSGTSATFSGTVYTGGATTSSALTGASELIVQNEIGIQCTNTTGPLLRMIAGSVNGNVTIQTDAVTGSQPGLVFNVGAAERMKIGSTGLITVTGSGLTGEAEGIFFKRTSSLNQGGIISGSGGGLILTATNAESGLYGTTVFQRYSGTTFAESMRITSDGVVAIGTTGVMINESSLGVTSSGNTSTIRTTSTGGSCILAWNSATSGNNSFFEFGVDAGFSVKGSITYNRGASVTMYNTTSDANLKNIIGNSDKQKSIDILNSTKIIEYSWKEDKTNKPQIGVIAQELYETFKGAVTKGSNAELLGTENYKTWGVDKTAFTFHLIAGWQKHEQMIQEQQALITSLQEQINELKNK